MDFKTIGLFLVVAFVLPPSCCESVGLSFFYFVPSSVLWLVLYIYFLFSSVCLSVCTPLFVPVRMNSHFLIGSRAIESAQNKIKWKRKRFAK
jgi:hypothetical protein